MATSETSALCINSGKLYAIGANSYGLFGRGDTSTSYNSFDQIGSDSDWVSVNMTRYNAQAIKGSGNVLYTAGRNNEGQNGNGTTSGNQTTFTAVDATNMVSGTNNNVTLVKGSQNVVGFIQSGRAFMCGRSDSNCTFGQNITVDQDVMIQVGSVGGSLQTNWTKLAPTYYSTNLLNSNGELYHQGSGQYYLSGDGSTTDHKDQAVRSGTFTDATDLVISHTEYNASRAGVVRGGKVYYAGLSKSGNICLLYTSPSPRD